MQSIYSYRIKGTPEWRMVRKIREQIQKLFTVKNKKIAMAVMIAASELVENAIKYGKPEIDIDCKIDSNVLTLSASNEIVHREDLDNLKDHIEKIKAAKDPFQLYVEMLTEVMEYHQEKSLLGLYRIAGEAQFMLDYLEHNNRITVVAQRKVDRGKRVATA